MQGKHQKHTKLAKPFGGQYHRNEWTIIGAPCSVLADFVTAMKGQSQLADDKIGYLDMSHSAESMTEPTEILMTDKIDHWVLKSKLMPQERDYRVLFNKLDLLFVNGNHFKGDQQIVFINNKKKESLHKKLDRLTNISCVILDEGEDAPWTYLEAYITKHTKLFKITELEKVAAFIKQKDQPTLSGLILSGGKSQRMGTDKGQIDYHGKPQKEFLADLISGFCGNTYLSEAKHTDDSHSTYPIITDSFLGLGPFGGILSAFRSNPNTGWLALACDLPHIDKATIRQLVEARNTSKVATCFHNPETEFPEPLITIWEPRAYPILLDYLAQGYSCPRKVLINSDIELLSMSDPIKMTNANTPEEKKVALDYIQDTDKLL